MQAIQPPKGTYKKPPELQLIRCPHCNAVLNQHLPGAAVSIGDNGKSEERSPGLIDLYSDAPEAPATPPPPPPPPELVASGDIFAPTAPKIVKTFEQVQGGNARQDKQARMVIPGMAPKEVPQDPVRHKNFSGLKVLDHAAIGGKVTICVLLYGHEHFNIHRRCLRSICESVPPSRMELRVACNQVGLETMNMLRTMPVFKLYEDHKQRRKYPAMRAMFHDTTAPITTNYVVWFDDDSYVLNDQWLQILGATIVAQRPNDRVGCYGHRMYHPLQIRASKDPRKWFQNAKWWKNKPFQDAKGRETPNGDKIHFAVGGFWCISLEAIKTCDIPDTRLNHNGGDCCIGEQLHQNGFKIKQFNEAKQFIKTSGAPRRGFHEQFPFYR